MSSVKDVVFNYIIDHTTYAIEMFHFHEKDFKNVH